MIVYGWDNTGGAAAGYAGNLQLAGEETAFCDEGLMITKNQDLITITGKMLGYLYDYQLNVQVGPKKATTIEIVSDNMEVAPDFWEPNDLKLTAHARGYAFEISLFFPDSRGRLRLTGRMPFSDTAPRRMVSVACGRDL